MTEYDLTPPKHKYTSLRLNREHRSNNG